MGFWVTSGKQAICTHGQKAKARALQKWNYTPYYTHIYSVLYWPATAYHNSLLKSIKLSGTLWCWLNNRLNVYAFKFNRKPRYMLLTVNAGSPPFRLSHWRFKHICVSLSSSWIFCPKSSFYKTAVNAPFTGQTPTNVTPDVKGKLLLSCRTLLTC